MLIGWLTESTRHVTISIGVMFQEEEIRGGKRREIYLSSCLPVLLCEVEQSPFVRRKSGNDEEDDADSDIGKQHAYPYLLGQRVQETEDARLLLHRFLDHDGDAQRHERLAEIYNSLPFRGYCYWSYGHVSFLQMKKQT